MEAARGVLFQEPHDCGAVVMMNALSLYVLERSYYICIWRCIFLDYLHRELKHCVMHLTVTLDIFRTRNRSSRIIFFLRCIRMSAENCWIFSCVYMFIPWAKQVNDILIRFSNHWNWTPSKVIPLTKPVQFPLHLYYQISYISIIIIIISTLQVKKLSSEQSGARERSWREFGSECKVTFWLEISIAHIRYKNKRICEGVIGDVKPKIRKTLESGKS